MTIEIANRLTQLRKDKGLSQEELAEKIGVSRQAISKWERGEACPETENLIELSKLYGVSIDSILKGEEPKKEEAETMNLPAEEEVETVEGEVVDPVDEEEELEKKVKKGALWTLFSSILFPSLVLAYLLMGFFWKGPNGENIGWAAGWTIFLFGIFASSVPFAVKRRRFSYLAIAPLVVGLYVAICMIVNTYVGVLLWHPLWVMIFIIPIFHAVVAYFDSKR